MKQCNQICSEILSLSHWYVILNFFVRRGWAND